MENTKPSISIEITQEVEDKIRYMCGKYPNNEWSGILFYEVKNKSKLVTKDILVLDIGSKAFTEFDLPVEMAYYIADNGYERLQRGLIHSHNTMSTFFSGTDTDTLKKEGADNVHFLSLIVNNEGTYSAKITKKITRESLVKDEYLTFGDKVVRNPQRKEKSVVVSWQDVEIIYPREDKFSGILDVYNEVRKRREAEKVEKEPIKGWDFSTEIFTKEGQYTRIEKKQDDLLPLKRFLAVSPFMEESKPLWYYISRMDKMSEKLNSTEFCGGDVSIFLTDIASLCFPNGIYPKTIEYYIGEIDRELKGAKPSPTLEYFMLTLEDLLEVHKSFF